MSKSTNRTEKVQVAGYGLHYHANNKLFRLTSDRMMLQYLIDTVRGQLRKSLDNQTIMLSMQEMGRNVGIDGDRTVSSCLERLEEYGIIKKHKNGVTVLCDEYVTLIKHYESLSEQEQKKFAKEFRKNGIQVLENYGVAVKLQCRAELLGLSGSSISVSKPEHCNITVFPTIESDSTVILQEENKIIQDNESGEITVILQQFAESVAKSLYFYSGYCNFTEFSETLPTVILQCGALDDIKYAFSNGKWPESFFLSLKNHCIFTVPTTVILQCLASKSLYFYSTVIIKDKKENKRDLPIKNEVQTEEENEDYREEIKKGFESFGKVEVLDLDKPSEEIKEDYMEIEDISQQTLKRADRQLRERNSYRKKPFIKVERVKEIVDCLDEVVKSPVDFFLYQFWWGIFDLYCDHYHPSTRIDEEGDIEDEPQESDWKEMIGAALPQDEIHSLAQNVYKDMLGAIAQGKYVYGDNNEWEVRFGFTTFSDFNPHEIFQWSPCTMQDKSVPALKVAIDRFYNIEANDVFTPSKGGNVDKRAKNSQNKKLISLILSADDSNLTPIESAIKDFYHDFVVSGHENIIDEFTDGKGTALESGGGLPDHLLKPWCYNLPSVGYKEFTGVLNSKYKPCDGVHKKAYIFSAENVVEWNERNGYTNTIAHEALQ